MVVFIEFKISKAGIKYRNDGGVQMSIKFQDIRRGVINLYRREILRDGPLLEAKRWFRDDGDATLRLDYPLNADSVVVDLGGYKGDWAQQIYDRYSCNVHVFEPHPRFYQECRQRFDTNDNVSVYNYGLSNSEGKFSISDDGDASSFAKVGRNGPSIDCNLRSAHEAFGDIGLSDIDLLKINIEGGEFQVLPNLFRNEWMARIRFLQIQFHTVGNFKSERDSIRKQLSVTHSEQWCYEFVWEGWARN